jgi:hypothetical protein
MACAKIAGHTVGARGFSRINERAPKGGENQNTAGGAEGAERGLE